MYFTPNKDFKICSEADYPEFIARITPLIEDASESGYFESFDGLKLRYRYIKVENAKASVVILHGLTEFIQKYYEMAWYLLNSGYNVFLFDQRGHGYSGREVDDPHIVHVNDFMDYAKDLDAIVKGLVVPNSDGKPIYTCSHSMGGAVVFLYLSRFENPIRKAAFSSPMIEPKTANLPRPVLLHFFRKQRKKEGPTKKFIYSGTWNPDPDFTKATDKSYNRFLSNLNIRREDTHYQNSSASNAWIDESYEVKPKLMDKKFISKIDIPMLVMLADDDTLVKTSVTQKFIKLNKNIKVAHISNSKHTIYTSSPEAIEEFYDKLIKYYDSAES